MHYKPILEEATNNATDLAEVIFNVIITKKLSKLYQELKT